MTTEKKQVKIDTGETVVVNGTPVKLVKVIQHRQTNQELRLQGVLEWEEPAQESAEEQDEESPEEPEGITLD